MLELGIRKRSGERVAQTARGGRLAELDDESGERRARAAGTQQSPGDGKRQTYENG